jgi:hypothetical protein
MPFQFLNSLRTSGALLSTALLAVLSLPAQDIGDSVITAALGVPTETTGTGSPAVYLSWWPTGSTAWTPGNYAIYRKIGEPGDPGGFSLIAEVSPLTDPISVGYAINRAEILGDESIQLANNIDGLFDKLVPVAGMPLFEKLAAIIQVAELDEDSAENLTLLTRRHPAAAMAAGVGFVDSVDAGTVYTYEIRMCPEDAVSASDCTTVSGRIVVKGGTVSYLPAPGQPVEVPFVDDSGDRDPRSNLNVPLRWATPDDLRERSFFQFGYDLYRVDVGLAADRGWDSGTPDRAEFLELLALEPELVHQVNNVPILTDELFDAASAADVITDPETFFFIDDNRRFEEGGTPFSDGDQFYYFVAARDLLGRPGQISEGTLVTVCFGIAPQAPRGLEVFNHYSWDSGTDTQTQVFRLEWDPAETRENGPAIAGYWIYRWSSIQEMQEKAGLPFSGLPGGSLTGGRIATVPAGTTSYIDNVGPHPFITYSRGGDLSVDPLVDNAEAGKTYWYSVRAIDASVCGGNVSGNSGPAFGVLRDRVGPDAPTGRITADCLLPLLSLSTQEIVSLPAPYNSELVYLQVNVLRTDPAFEWVDLYASPLGDSAYLGRFFFPEVGDVITTNFTRRKLELLEADLKTGKIYARAGLSSGEISNTVEADFSLSLDVVGQDGYVQSFDFVASLDRENDCIEHVPDPPGGLGGSLNPLDIEIYLTPTSEEWRLYRSVDSGPLTLLQQGLKSFDPADFTVTTQDVNFPLNGGRVCYYAQCFDEQGLPSKLIRLGCRYIARRTELPQPMLSPVEPKGNDPENGSARLEWFCPPEGVERFELWIRSDNEVGPLDPSDDLRLNLPPPPNDQEHWSRYYESATGKNFRAYYTGRVGANFDNGPEFDLFWQRQLETGLRYHIRVRAVGVNNRKGPWSNEESFTWTPEIDFTAPFDPSTCVVPWPMLGLPAVDDTFAVEPPSSGYEVGLEAVYRPLNLDGTVAYNGAAVRVGMLSIGKLDVQIPSNWDSLPKPIRQGGFFQLPRGKEDNLRGAFYETIEGETLLDFALYRYQVPNANWPSVSGDVYQVSPIIDGLAAQKITAYYGDGWAVFDPYFFILPIPESLGTIPTYDLYLKDTQPVIAGASYRYLVVRFDELGEIVQIIPLPVLHTN